MMFLRKLGVFVFIALFFSTSLHATPSENALAWLAQQQQADGYFAAPSDLATPYQSSAEALLLIRETSEIEPSIIEAAFSYLHSPAQQTTEYLSRRIIADIAFGYPVSDELIELLSRQNRYGGFGEHAGYHETVIDTSFALSAISAADKNQHQVISLALQNLLSKQQDDGGWRDGSNVDSIYLTALAMQAMTPYSNVYAGVSMALSKAQDYLLGLRQGDGGWGEGYKTAAVVLGLAPNIADMAVLDASYAKLQQSQAEDGSWHQDVYTTALAARALNSFESDVVVDDTHASSITGLVVHAASGIPLNDVSIVINELPGVKATTGSDGGFAIPNLSVQSYTLSISKQGYASISRVIEVQENQIFQLGTVSLNTVQETGLVYGMAIDDETGQALSGVTVKISDSSNQQSLTAEDGRFELHTLSPGEYTVTLSKSGYSTVFGTVSVNGGNITNIRVPMTLEGSYQTTDGEISGTVVDGESGLPVVGASFELSNGLLVLTDNAGKFVVSAVERDSYSANISAPGYLEMELSVLFTSNTSGELGTLVIYTNTNEQVPAMLTVYGTVIDAVSGEPVSDVLVNTDAGVSTGSDVNGNFVLTNLTVNDIAFSLSKVGYQTTSHYVSRSAYGSTQVVLPIALSGETNSDKLAPYMASGVVVDDRTGLPLSDVSIIAFSGGDYYILSTDSNGHFFIGNATSSDLLVYYSAAGYIGKKQLHMLAPFVLTNLDEVRLYHDSVLLPDMTVTGFQSDGVSTDPTSLTYSGYININVSNSGTAATRKPVSILAFYDVNGDGLYQENTDIDLGGASTSIELAIDGSEVVSLFVSGKLPFRDAAIHVWVDSEQEIEERHEDNNTLFSAVQCQGFPGLNEGPTNDLSVSVLEVVSGDGGFPDLRVRVGNAGLNTSPDGVMVSFYEGNPAEGGALLGSEEVPTLSANNYQDIFLQNVVGLTGVRDIYAFVDSHNRLAECSETNNITSIPPPELVPDLLVSQVNISEVVSDPQTFEMEGTVRVDIKNQGSQVVDAEVNLLAFIDIDNDAEYSAGTDVVLGRSALPEGLLVGDTVVAEITVLGDAPFRDAPVSVWVDSSEAIAEQREDNNTASSILSCRVELGNLSEFAPVLKWHWQEERVLTIPLVARISDTNLDGVINSSDDPIVIFSSHTGSVDWSPGTLRAVNGVTGETIWTVSDPDLRTGAATHAAVGDIDGDGNLEVLMYLWNGGIAAINNDGSLKWKNTQHVKPQYYNYASISLADLEGDGKVEILAKNHIFNSDGSLRWSAPDAPNSNVLHSVAADLDLDGVQEVLLGARAYRSNGEDYWDNSNVPVGHQALANFDDDPWPEIVVVVQNFVYLLDDDASVLWEVDIPTGGWGAPTIADMDGDGHPEIGVAGKYRYVVFESDGSILWSNPTTDSSRITGSTVFDFNDDGRPEVLYGDEHNLRVYDGLTGRVVYEIENPSATATEYPVVANVDSDANAELLLVSTQWPIFGVRAFEGPDDGWAATRSIWNQYDYHVTNVNDDGSIPRQEQPSWLSHNTYRLNKFADRNASDIVDLTVGMLSIADSPSGVSFELIVGNGGLAPSADNTRLTIYAGDPINGGRLLANTQLEPIGANAYKRVSLRASAPYDGSESLYALVDDSDAVVECNENNNRIVLPPHEQEAQLGTITVHTNQPVYIPGSLVQLSAEVINTGSLINDYSPRVVIEDVNGVVIQSFAEQPITGLAAGASLTFTEVWNTAAYLSGSYRLHGFLYGLDGSLLSESTSLFDIRHSADDGPDAGLRLTTDKAQYHSSDAVNITGLVNNLTERHILQGSRLQLRLTHIDGTQEELGEWPVRELMPQTSHEQHVAHVLNKAQEGIYGISGTLLDSSGNILATDSTSFSVKEDLSIALSGRVVTQVPSLYRGDVQRCTDTISNAGSMNLAAQPIRYVVADLNNGVEFQYSDSVIELPSGGEYSSEREVDTSDYSIGMHACLLQTQINGNWTTLAYQSFDVMAPPIEIDSMLMRGEHGRLLVLLDTAKGACNGLSSVTLSAELDLLPAAAASLQAELLDANGSVLDVEQALMSVDMPVNLSLAANDADLSISAFTHESLQVAVNLGSPVLNTGYRVRLSLIDGEGSYSFDSGLFTPDCELSELDVLGDLRVADVGILTASNDPLSKPELATLEEQRELLETWLDEAGWSYTIVTDAMDFTRELRSGAYTTYLLHGEHERLAIPVQKELREAIYRGEGLVVAGSHDERHHNIDEALGIKVAGKLNHVDGLYLVGELSDLGRLHFTSPRQLLRYEPEQHEILAQTLSRRWPAISLNRYGEGRSMTIGFDLLAEAAQDGAEVDILGSILLDALDTVHPRTVIYPEAIHATVGSVYPLRIMLRNIGIPTEGQVMLMLPEGGEVVDVHGGYEEDGGVIWPFELAEEQLLFLDLWLRLPESPGGLSLEAQIYTGAPGSMEYYGSSSLEFELDTLTELQDVQTNLDELRVNHNGDVTLKHVGRDLDKANSYNASGDIESALLQMVRAADELIDDERREFDTLRRRLADALRTVAADLTD